MATVRKSATKNSEVTIGKSVSKVKVHSGKDAGAKEKSSAAFAKAIAAVHKMGDAS